MFRCVIHTIFRESFAYLLKTICFLQCCCVCYTGYEYCSGSRCAIMEN